MSTPNQTVWIGEQEWRIQRFKTFKATYAGRIMSGVSEAVSEIVEADEQFCSDFGERHKRVYTRGRVQEQLAEAEAALEQATDPQERIELSESVADWQGMLDGPLQSVESAELPQVPANLPRLVHVLPKAIEAMPEQVRQLVGLVLISNKELGDAEDADEVTEALSKLGKHVFRESEPHELLDVVRVSWETIREQVTEAEIPLGKLQALYERAQSARADRTSERSQTDSTPTGFDPKVVAGGGEILPAPTEAELALTTSGSSPRSSTSSDAPTAGPDTT